MSGFLHIVIGPMFAGKTTELIRQINRFKNTDRTVMFINHAINDRSGSNEKVITHDKMFQYNKCVALDCLEDAEIEDSDIIMVDELQFFDDSHVLQNWVQKQRKHVIAAGLSSDYMKRPFESVMKLIPYADKITHKTAICKYCGRDAPFTQRKFKRSCSTDLEEDNVIEVAADDLYESVCRLHHSIDFLEYRSLE